MNEGIETPDAKNATTPDDSNQQIDVKSSNLSKYKVTGPDGIYKDGKAYPKGSVIELDKATADNLKSVGGVEG